MMRGSTAGRVTAEMLVLVEVASGGVGGAERTSVEVRAEEDWKVSSPDQNSCMKWGMEGMSWLEEGGTAARGRRLGDWGRR
jgi:hypothetical protein